MPVREADERRIFPALLSDAERLLLDRLSSEAGLSESEVLPRLIYKEFSTQQLLRHGGPPSVA